MGLLDRLKKKCESLGKAPKGSLLKVNMYENPKKTLDLIAHICTSASGLDLSACFQEYEKTLREVESIIAEDQDYTLSNKNLLLSDCSRQKQEIEDKLTENPYSTVKIAVAGGYSSGKSSLLNTLINAENLLPTGIEPVSIVNTFLNCSSSVNEIFVMGKNMKHETVLLNKEVLDCIQHSSSSKVYIASVLDKLMVTVPSVKEFDGITFVDTPGYNNSNNVNVENNAKDIDKAKEALGTADAIIWCIDIEAGAITKHDLEMLDLAKDKPLLIVFTKMDKKPEKEVVKILETALKSFVDRYGKDTQLIDIIAFSGVSKDFKSLKKTDLTRNIISLREECIVKDVYKESENAVKALIDQELEE